MLRSISLNTNHLINCHRDGNVSKNGLRIIATISVSNLHRIRQILGENKKLSL